MIDRSKLNQALAKAIAYKEVGDEFKARVGQQKQKKSK